MCNNNWSLDRLTVNVDNDPVGRRSLTRPEVFALAWLIFNKEGRNYRDMMRDCKLSLEQCETAVRGLIELDLLRLS